MQIGTLRVLFRRFGFREVWWRRLGFGWGRRHSCCWFRFGLVEDRSIGEERRSIAVESGGGRVHVWDFNFKSQILPKSSNWFKKIQFMFSMLFLDLPVFFYGVCLGIYVIYTLIILWSSLLENTVVCKNKKPVKSMLLLFQPITHLSTVVFQVIFCFLHHIIPIYSSLIFKMIF